MKHRKPVQLARCAAVAGSLAAAALPAQAEQIAHAAYAEPTPRYGHHALGAPHEYARLLATTDAGRRLALELPEPEVFEDLAPRRVRLAAGAPAELLVIVSARRGGARLALVGLRDGALAITAQSAPIGTPMRWLNPVGDGVADLDGDGVAEIAAVTTPHIGGTLRVYRRDGERLVELAALAGFSNHVYGSPELALSGPVQLAGRTQLLVPDQQRHTLRLVALQGGALVETARCPGPAPAAGSPIATPGPLRDCIAALGGAALPATR